MITINGRNVVIISSTEALIIYSNRPAVAIYSSDGDIENFARWFLADNVVISYPEFKQSMDICNEDTQEIKIA